MSLYDRYIRFCGPFERTRALEATCREWRGGLLFMTTFIYLVTLSVYPYYTFRRKITTGAHTICEVYR